MLSLLFGGTFVILFCEYVYFTFCRYVLSSVVSYFTVLLWFVLPCWCNERCMLDWSGLWAADSARSSLRDIPLRALLPIHRFLLRPLHPIFDTPAPFSAPLTLRSHALLSTQYFLAFFRLNYSYVYQYYLTTIIGYYLWATSRATYATYQLISLLLPIAC